MKAAEGETLAVRRPRERGPDAVLMGIISFYLRRLGLRWMVISQQSRTVPSKENVCV